MTQQQQFHGRLLSTMNHVLLYENPELQKKALSVIPLAEIREKAASAVGLEMQRDDRDPKFRDQVIVELLSWFKLEFFAWFDKALCHSCNIPMENDGYADPTPEDARYGGSRVESYKCKQCNASSRFPRYNDPGKLLDTRTGRCGEWANCFTLLCRSLGYKARYVFDWTDHVWTEVYSDFHQGWIHCDSCEAAFDKPLLYEAGWGKKLSYIIGFSKDDVQDVTWRYTAKHKEILKRRTLVSETWLLEQTAALTKHLQSKFGADEKKALSLRLIRELCLLLTPPVAKQDELQGRTSGDIQWRSSRGELGPSVSERSVVIVWKPTKEEIETGDFCLEYSSPQDFYVRQSDSDKRTRGWQNGVYENQNVFRKVEYDWKMAYLARTENSDTGSLIWKFDLSDFENLAILQVIVSCPGETFENGGIQWKVCTENSCEIVPNGSKNYEVDGSGAKWCTLSVRLSGGTSWQHAQIARQPVNDKSFPLMLRVFFGNFN
nr:EOG090X06HD [Eulimnadia texana]